MNTAGLCGYTNWRMPTVEELQSIADMGRFNPVIDPTYFPTLGNPYGGYEYWSSSAIAYNAYGAWYVGFDDGNVNWYFKPNGLAVRLVRSQ